MAFRLESYVLRCPRLLKTDQGNLYPAWDEGDGIRYPDIVAESKSEANRIARRQADQDGHLAGGKGHVTFTAVEQ
ncbi:hypothetical protein A8O37_25525 [Pseudomonas aeruginosa]|nr:hypothetical protein A8O37_25525 [Pseudomonas aeruginosa]